MGPPSRIHNNAVFHTERLQIVHDANNQNVPAEFAENCRELFRDDVILSRQNETLTANVFFRAEVIEGKNPPSQPIPLDEDNFHVLPSFRKLILKQNCPDCQPYGSNFIKK